MFYKYEGDSVTFRAGMWINQVTEKNKKRKNEKALKLVNNGSVEAPLRALASLVKFICHHPSEPFSLLIRRGRRGRGIVFLLRRLPGPCRVPGSLLGLRNTDNCHG